MTAPSFPRPPSKITSTGEIVVGGILVIVMLPIAVAVGAFAFMNLWNWFVAPPTHFAELSFWGAFGFSLVVAFLKQGLSTYKEKEPSKDSLLGRVFAVYVDVIGGCLFLLGMGWVVHTFLI